VTLFGKNSDREPDEAQNVEIHPGGRHGKGETVDCTTLTIPQAEETHRVLLCRPFWMFGAEMGAKASPEARTGRRKSAGHRRPRFSMSEVFLSLLGRD
jgi:hypothetical protein